uniref:Uncharacterized protein n=1 Tax=Zea mays TaxID=4577 RepID=A0A804PSC1_MAIZE
MTHILPKPCLDLRVGGSSSNPSFACIRSRSVSLFRFCYCPVPLSLTRAHAATSVTAIVSARRRGSPTARGPRTGSPRSSAVRGTRKRWRRRRRRRRSRQRPAAPGPPRTTRIRQVARSRPQRRAAPPLYDYRSMPLACNLFASS